MDESLLKEARQAGEPQRVGAKRGRGDGGSPAQSPSRGNGHTGRSRSRNRSRSRGAKRGRSPEAGSAHDALKHAAEGGFTAHAPLAETAAAAAAAAAAPAPPAFRWGWRVPVAARVDGGAPAPAPLLPPISSPAGVELPAGDVEGEGPGADGDGGGGGDGDDAAAWDAAALLSDSDDGRGDVGAGGAADEDAGDDLVGLAGMALHSPPPGAADAAGEPCDAAAAAAGAPPGAGDGGYGAGAGADAASPAAADAGPAPPRPAKPQQFSRPVIRFDSKVIIPSSEWMESFWSGEAAMLSSTRPAPARSSAAAAEARVHALRDVLELATHNRWKPTAEWAEQMWADARIAQNHRRGVAPTVTEAESGADAQQQATQPAARDALQTSIGAQPSHAPADGGSDEPPAAGAAACAGEAPLPMEVDAGDAPLPMEVDAAAPGDGDCLDPPASSPRAAPPLANSPTWLIQPSAKKPLFAWAMPPRAKASSNHDFSRSNAQSLHRSPPSKPPSANANPHAVLRRAKAEAKAAAKAQTKAFLARARPPGEWAECHLLHGCASLDVPLDPEWEKLFWDEALFRAPTLRGDDGCRILQALLLLGPAHPGWRAPAVARVWRRMVALLGRPHTDGLEIVTARCFFSAGLTCPIAARNLVLPSAAALSKMEDMLRVSTTADALGGAHKGISAVLTSMGVRHTNERLCEHCFRLIDVAVEAPGSPVRHAVTAFLCLLPSPDSCVRVLSMQRIALEIDGPHHVLWEVAPSPGSEEISEEEQPLLLPPPPPPAPTPAAAPPQPAAADGPGAAAVAAGGGGEKAETPNKAGAGTHVRGPTWTSQEEGALLAEVAAAAAAGRSQKSAYAAAAAATGRTPMAAQTCHKAMRDKGTAPQVARKPAGGGGGPAAAAAAKQGTAALPPPAAGASPAPVEKKAGAAAKEEAKAAAKAAKAGGGAAAPLSPSSDPRFPAHISAWAVPGCGVSVTPRTRLRDSLLAAAGWRVVVVSIKEWSAACAAQKGACASLLRSRLHAAGYPCAAEDAHGESDTAAASGYAPPANNNGKQRAAAHGETPKAKKKAATSQAGKVKAPRDAKAAAAPAALAAVAPADAPPTTRLSSFAPGAVVAFLRRLPPQLCTVNSLAALLEPPPQPQPLEASVDPAAAAAAAAADASAPSPQAAPLSAVACAQTFPPNAALQWLFYLARFPHVFAFPPSRDQPTHCAEVVDIRLVEPAATDEADRHAELSVAAAFFSDGVDGGAPLPHALPKADDTAPGGSGLVAAWKAFFARHPTVFVTSDTHPPPAPLGGDDGLSRAPALPRGDADAHASSVAAAAALLAAAAARPLTNCEKRVLDLSNPGELAHWLRARPPAERLLTDLAAAFARPEVAPEDRMHDTRGSKVQADWLAVLLRHPSVFSIPCKGTSHDIFRAATRSPIILRKPWAHRAVDAAKAHAAARELGAAASALSGRALPESFDSIASQLSGLGGLLSSLPAEGAPDVPPGSRAALWAAFFASRPDCFEVSPTHLLRVAAHAVDTAAADRAAARVLLDEVAAADVAAASAAAAAAAAAAAEEAAALGGRLRVDVSTAGEVVAWVRFFPPASGRWRERPCVSTAASDLGPPPAPPKAPQRRWLHFIGQHPR